MPTPKRVVSHEEDEDARPDHAAPVHLARRRARSRGEELEEPEHGEESQRDDVDRVAGFAEVEARGWERFAAESLAEDTWVAPCVSKTRRSRWISRRGIGSGI